MDQTLNTAIREAIASRIQVQHHNDGPAPEVVGIDEAVAAVEAAILARAAAPALSFSDFCAQNEQTVPVIFVEPTMTPEEVEKIVSSDLLVDQTVGGEPLTQAAASEDEDHVETTEDTMEDNQAAPPVVTELPQQPAPGAPGPGNPCMTGATWWEDNESERLTGAPAPITESAGAFDEAAMVQLIDEVPFLAYVQHARLRGNNDAGTLFRIYTDYVRGDKTWGPRLAEISKR
jgi:hypothetical protein